MIGSRIRDIIVLTGIVGSGIGIGVMVYITLVMTGIRF